MRLPPSSLLLAASLSVAAPLACHGRRAEVTAAVTQPLPTPTWEVGQRHRYRVELASRIGLSSGEAMVSLSLRGDLVLHARPLDGGATQLAATVEQARLDSPDPAARPQLDALALELREPFVFTLAGGKVTETFPRPTASRFADSIARTLAASLQVAAQPSAGTTTWKANEFDATGEYVAEYARAGAGLELSKRKTGYESLALGTLSLTRVAATVTPKVQESSGTVLLLALPDGRTRLQRVTSAEQIEVEVTSTTPMKSSTSLSLELVERLPATLDFGALLAERSRLAAGARAATRTEGPNYDATRIGDYTFETAARELEALAADPRANALNASENETPLPAHEVEERESRLRADSKAFTAMAALLRSDPKHVPLAVARIRGESTARRALLDALSAAGTAEAQTALVELMNDARSPLEWRRAAASSLIRTPAATAATIAALSAHVGKDDLHVHAIYGLGTIARRLRERGESAAMGPLVKVLIDNLAVAPSRPLRIHALRALANAGDATALQAVRPWLADENDIVRAAAVDALRLMEHPAIDGILVQQLRDGSDPVALAALDAIAVRKPTVELERVLVATVTDGKKPSVRIKAVKVLAGWLPSHPNLRATLAEASRKDPAEAVRKAAAQALGP